MKFIGFVVCYVAFIFSLFPVVEASTVSLACTSIGSCTCYSGGEACVIGAGATCINTNTCSWDCPSEPDNADFFDSSCSGGYSQTCICEVSGCAGGSCSCSVSGSCFYSCHSGYDDCDNNDANGCECGTPSNCCGGSGNNIRYYSCDICDGSSCASCDASSCTAQDCGTSSYCSSGSCSSCFGSDENCDENAANGCECSQPSNCCGTGVAKNRRYYNCDTCDGTDCATCGWGMCSWEECGTDSYCSSGSCSSCSGTLANCDEDPSNVCEVDTDDDTSNCGLCDNVCPDSYGACGYQTCSSGDCGNTAYAAGQRSGCTGTTGCSTDGTGAVVCACDGVNSCDDTCGNDICDSWEDIGICPFDCGSPNPELDSMSHYPDPVNNGTDVNFTVDWSNSNETEQIKIHICKNGTLTAGSCEAGSWCDSATLTLEDPTSCNYTTTAADNGTMDFYAFVCDEANNCSASSYDNFTVNIPPEVSGAGDSPDPANVGTQVNFTVDWDDDNSTEMIKAHICKSTVITSGTCDAGSWCDSAAYTTDDPTSCNYTTLAGDSGSNDYYSFVCDDDGLCSGYSSGSFTVNVGPTISSVSDSPDPVGSGIDSQFAVDWNDNDAGDQIKIHVCKTDSLTSGSCTEGSWCDSATFTTDDPTACNYTTQIADSGTQNYYVFVCDDGGLCSSSTSGSFSVVVITENRLWLTLYVNDTTNNIYIPGSGQFGSGTAYTKILLYPTYPYIASYLNDKLNALVAISGRKVAVVPDNTSSNHSLIMVVDLSGSKIALANTKGDWNTIDSRNSIISVGRFLDAFSPSFAYGLGKAATITVMLTYEAIDLTKTAIFNKGKTKLYAHNIGESGGNVQVNVTA